MTAGLRERKKQQTREHISAVATTLFAASGFEAVTIAEVARAADVAKMTVTNYFPLKENLVFDRYEEIIRLLADAVLSRPAGVTVLDAVTETYLDGLRRRRPILGFVGRHFAELVEGSPALRAREREIFAAQEDALAEVLRAERGSSAADVEPRVAAMQIAGVIRVLYYEGRRRLRADEPTEAIVAALDAAYRSAATTLEHGLAVSYRRGG
jgi:AcrR family transcriptional regulator